jgi:HSP20 family protein
MEEERTNGNSRKNKWVLAITTVIVLTGSNIYFFTKYNEQSKLIEHQVHYINELEANITKSSTDNDTNAHFDQLFNCTWNAFKHQFLDVENIITNSWNNGIIHHNQYSSYRYLSINTTDKEYNIKIALPGFSKEEVSLELSDNMLTVNTKSLNHNTNKDDDNTDADDNNKEHVTNTIQSIRIPNDINSDNIQATLNNGLLIITLPRVNDGSAKEAKIIPVN